MIAPSVPVPPPFRAVTVGLDTTGGLRTELRAHGLGTDLGSPPRFVVLSLGPVTARYGQPGYAAGTREYPWTAEGEAAARTRYAALVDAARTVTA